MTAGPDPARRPEACLERGGEQLWLLPEKAVLLPDHQTLLVADAHIGKAQSFRRLGVPVPAGTTQASLQRLSGLLARWQVRQLVFLGDFLHSAHAHAPATQAALADWRSDHGQVQMTLVRGNHDDHAGDPPADLGMVVVDEPLPLGGLRLCHHPRPQPDGYVLAGHLHPCVRLGGRANDRLRLPCFHFEPRLGVLPAFGDFTGMHPVRPQPGDAVFAVAGELVRAVYPVTARAAPRP